MPVPHWVVDSESTRFACAAKPLLFYSSLKIGPPSYQCTMNTHSSSWFFTFRVPQRLLLLWVGIFWYTKPFQNSEEAGGHWGCARPPLAPGWRYRAPFRLWWGQKFLHLRNTEEPCVGGENRSDSREGKKLKNHDSLALEHLTSHVLPREKPPCFPKLWVQTKNRNVQKATAWDKHFLDVLPEAWVREMGRMHDVRWTPWDNVNLFCTTYSAVVWDFSLKYKDFRW